MSIGLVNDIYRFSPKLAEHVDEVVGVLTTNRKWVKHTADIRVV